VNANAFPNQSQCSQVWGSAQYVYKPEGNEVRLPLMVEIEAYDDCPEQLRFSLRCGGSPFLAQAFYQIFLMLLES